MHLDKQEKWFQFLPTPKTRVYTLLSLSIAVYQQENRGSDVGIVLGSTGVSLTSTQ